MGYSHRMPGGIDSDAQFWDLLSQRKIVREPIATRYGRGHAPIGEFSGPGRFASPYEGLILDENELLFDPTLFGMSQNELTQTEPQIRMLLNCAWETIEQAGWSLNSLRNSATGVFVGSQVPAAANWRPPHGVTEHSVAGISLAMLANRISYYFNLMGSSATYCTACSAGLSAMHAAMNALACGDCDQALVGGVTYLGSARMSSSFNLMGVISPDGKCRSFDAGANGYMRSEGSFVFAIKPLQAAEQDGDSIFAVIEATAVNAAGSADGAIGHAPGRFISAPTQHSQVALMRDALARCGRSALDIDYIEAHATGTAVGDPIEGNAIAQAFGGTPRDMPLRVSSVKSNVGHMEAAAFHCALLKVVLMIQQRTFAPTSLNFKVPNPAIDFDSCPMQVQTTCESFPDHPAVFGINSFGFGGANGHCVVSEYRPAQPRLWSVPLAPKGGYLVPLSGRTNKALIDTARQLLGVVEAPNFDLYTLAGNLSCRRTHFPVRAAFAARSFAELIEMLSTFVEQESSISPIAEGKKRLAMVFSGQGTQWAGCGRELYASHPVFRRTIDAIEQHWRAHSRSSLRKACLSTSSAQKLDEVQLAQPAIFMIQCALLELLKTWGVYPDCVVGHSSGEVAAAYACGALSLADATRLVYHRAKLQQQVAGSGRMLAIGLDRAGTEHLLEELAMTAGPDSKAPCFEVACENGPANTVICGAEHDMHCVIEELDRRKVQHSLIPGNIAFHSRVMDAIEQDVLRTLSFLDHRTFEFDVPFVSSVTGTESLRLDCSYWWSNIRQTVRFAEAMETVRRDYQPDVILEIAPHCALQPIIAQCMETASSAPTVIPTFQRNVDTALSFHLAVGELFKAGVALDFAAQYPRPKPVTHLLPGHPREPSKLDNTHMDDEFGQKGGDYAHGPLVGHQIGCYHPLFEGRLCEAAFPWLVEHRVHHAPIMPAAGFIELVLQAIEGKFVCIEMLEFLQPCPIPTVPVRLQTALHPTTNSHDEFTLTISTQAYEPDSSAELHCRGRLRLVNSDFSPKVPEHLSQIDTSGYEELEYAADDQLYERFETVLGETFQYGPQFRNMRQLRRDVATDNMLFEVEIDATLWRNGQQEGYFLFPTLLDGGLQSYLYDLMLGADLFAIPLRAENVTFLRPPTVSKMICHVTYPSGIRYEVDDKGQYSVPAGEWVSGSLSCYDGATGDLFLHIDKYVSFISNPRRVELPNSKHQFVWQPKFIANDRTITAHLPAGAIEAVALLSAFEQTDNHNLRTYRALEFSGSRAPQHTVLHDCVEYLSQVQSCWEYWIFANDIDGAKAYFDAFHSQDAKLRFDSIDPELRHTWTLDEGLLRPNAAEVLFLSCDGEKYTPADWQLWWEVLVSGGFLLIFHETGAALEPGLDWTVLRATNQATLLQASARQTDQSNRLLPPGPRWILGEPGSFADSWSAQLDSDDAHVIPYEILASKEPFAPEDWPHAATLQAIDLFCGGDSQDPTGERVVTQFVSFIQSLVPYRIDQASNLCRITIATHKAAFEIEHARGSALWGAVRSMVLEFGVESKLDFRLVDLGDESDLETLAWLASHDLRERELALRNKQLWVARAVSLKARHSQVPVGDDPPYRLFLENAGQIDGLRMKTYDLPELAPGSVEIDVVASALNFRDVMVTLGLLPMLAYEHSALGREVGIEGSGVVRRTGAAVHEFAPGDEVILGDGGCIANRKVVSQHQLFHKPAGLNMEEAAASLSVYVTAYYALVHLARLRQGQRVLIHSAMGGIGQAAIALAHYTGAEIYATAGSEAKREQLLAMGVQAAFDSHSKDWLDGLMEATGGQGVDVVLNSLAGDHIALCLQALRAGGWHCEIGKVDIFADSSLSLRIFRKNLHFVAIDTDRLMLDDPVLSRELSLTCLNLLERNEVKPLPTTVFPYGEYDKALRLMISGQHQGKLVLKAPLSSAKRDFPIDDRRRLLDPDATYLITGGLGGFGQRLLPYLVTVGARHLTLMDRDPKRRRSQYWLRQSTTLAKIGQGVEIDLVQGDVSIKADVQRCVANVQKPLKGIFHLAGTLDDCLLADLGAESIKRVFAPKAYGALHLHHATADLALDYFVMVSTLSSVIGNPGQINYSAANAFVDGLAGFRRRQGLPALAYNLAAVSDAGMAARNLLVLRLMRAAGMPPVSSYFAVSNLDYALRTMGDHDHLVTALFKHVPWSIDSLDYLRTGQLMSNQDAFKVGSQEHRTVENVKTQIAAKVAELCGHEEGDADEPLSSYGLNSLSVAELGAFIHSEFNYRASALELMTTASCQSLAFAIVFGNNNDEDVENEDGTDTASDTLVANECHINRKPSEFASPIEDHFSPTNCMQ